MGERLSDRKDVQIEVVYSRDAINERLVGLAGEIASSGLESPIVVAILKGSFVFAADLIRALHETGMSPEVDFLTLSSYRGAKASSGRVEILRDMDLSVEGRDLLVVDDVLDSGRTLAFAVDLFSARGARFAKTCVLLDKKVPRAVDLTADFKAFSCGDDFVVGYGMDVAHRFRQLPYVGRLIG